MKSLNVDLGERSYPILIGPGLLGDPDRLRPYIRGREVMVVTNDTVAPLYLAQVQAMLDDYRVETLVLPDGERYKTLATVDQIWDALLSHNFSRQATLVALGGGVIGDITGFAAACYQRGVDFIQVPTTLLAQVDSSVGGKTGINHALGKNMIGAFYQPRAVIADTDTLDTLPDRELSAGIAEVIKYGLICNAGFFSWLEQNMSALRARDKQALAYAIEVSCQTKAEVVAADERESGKRALLNLGHTFGHAIENGMGYGEWLHGEAVGAGMCMAALLSNRLGWMDEKQTRRTIKLIEQAGLPSQAPASMSAEQFIELMSVDKKVLDGVLRLVLMKGIGKSVVTSGYTLDQLNRALEQSIAD